MSSELPIEEKGETPQSRLFDIVMIVGFASALLFVTRNWTLQAFVPEPYFLRTTDQLAELSSMHTPPDIRRSLTPLHVITAVEATLIAAIAVAALLFVSRPWAVAYALVIAGMALITLLRLGAAFRGI